MADCLELTLLLLPGGVVAAAGRAPEEAEVGCVLLVFVGCFVVGCVLLVVSAGCLLLLVVAVVVVVLVLVLVLVLVVACVSLLLAAAAGVLSCSRAGSEVPWAVARADRRAVSKPNLREVGGGKYGGVKERGWVCEW